ncbi:hypothetical protein QS257_14905 [Terrilactibacillus sp. S3-3]|nr:hypothetical protein QS257_14905 [Terrilactibacillus sp. S3-3]
MAEKSQIGQRCRAAHNGFALLPARLFFSNYFFLYISKTARSTSGCHVRQV